MSDGSRQELFSAWIDGRISADDSARLEAELRGSREARDEFRTWAVLDSLLVEQSVARAFTVADSAAAEVTRKRRWHVAAAVLIAGGLTAILVSVLVAIGIDTVRTLPLATVTDMRFPAVAEGARPLAIGQRLGPGPVSIDGGAVELSLRNGVVLVLEGDADLELRGEMDAFLHQGCAVVRMPKGMHGFQLSTPTTRVLDLGTEFAVKAGAGLVTDVQVYEGAVIAGANTADGGGPFPRRLEAGQAVRFLPHSAADAQPLPYVERRFVRRLTADLPAETATEEERKADRRWPGRPHFDSLVVAPAEAAVVIDGRLDEWRESPGFARTAHAPPGSRSVEVRGWMKYDPERLYIAAHVGDPEPMRSEIDPAIEPELGWAGGSVQVRLSTDRLMGWPAQGNSFDYFATRGIEPAPEQRAQAENPRLSHLTMWYHAASQTPCLTIAHGMLFRNLSVNPDGFRGVFTRDPDGQGYCLEYSIPWRLLNCADAPPRSGDVLAAIWQVHWSDATGRLRRSRDHLVEVRNPGEPLRINSWHRAATWGRAEYQ